jgi:serine/threonine protein kinase
LSDTPQTGSISIGVVLDGAYKIDGLLGQGGMGAVYLATQLRLEKTVAIKVMARELTSNPEALERFRREARVSSSLGHPHIVQVNDFSTTPSGEPFLVMEFLEGEDLDHRLRQVGRLAPRQVVHIVRQVASALAATHAKTIVHRDLKPGNIYLLAAAGESDFVKVLDFGISKVRSATTKLTRTSSIMGTPNYMSPEQAKGNIDDIDERTDQWALACIAWECLCGVGPFVGENVPSILFQIVHESPADLLSKVPGLHPQVERVLLRALAKNKTERFASVTEFAEALAQAAMGAPAPSVPQTGRFAPSALAAAPIQTTFSQAAGAVESPHDEARPRPKKRLRSVAAATGVFLLVAGWLTTRDRSASKPVAPPPASAPLRPAPPRPAEPPMPAAASDSSPTHTERPLRRDQPSNGKNRPISKPPTASSIATAPVTTTVPPAGPRPVAIPKVIPSTQASEHAVRAESPPQACPKGQSVTADTAGHCCWQGQAWSENACVGVPTACPDTLVIDSVGQRCRAHDCSDGRVLAADGTHCCWPGQVWSTARSACVGLPSCPAGYDRPPGSKFVEDCLRRPTLHRRADQDGTACTTAALAKAFVCDFSDYTLRGRIDATAEEVGDLRYAYGQASAKHCQRLANAQGACQQVRQLEGQSLWCCPN